MAILVNEGGKLFELTEVWENEGGTRVEQDEVWENEGGTMHCIFCCAFGNGENDILDWLAQYPDDAYITPSSNGFSLEASASVSQVFYTDGYIRLKAGQTITLDAQSSAYLSGGHTIDLAICDESDKELDNESAEFMGTHYTQHTGRLDCQDTLLHSTSLTVDKSGKYYIKLIYHTLGTVNRIKATLSFSK